MEELRKPEKPSEGEPAGDDRSGDDSADLLGEARALARDGAGIKGRSPESTKELQQSLNKFEDGASAGELEQAGSIVDKLASSLDKVSAKRAQEARDFLQRIQTLEEKVRMMENSGS